MIKKFYIYGLIDPLTSMIRYVGQSVDPNRRLYEHMKNTTHGTDDWIACLKAFDTKPIVVILEVVGDGISPAQREQYWIDTMSQTSTLLNQRVAINSKSFTNTGEQHIMRESCATSE